MRPIPSVAPLLVVLAAACGPGRAPPRSAPSYPGELRPPSDFAHDFLLRQELVVERGGERHRFQAALQRRGETLTLLGLTPLGTRAFVIEQRGLEVELTSHMPEGRELPFPPRFVLLDVQRALLPWLGEGALSDGEHRGEVAGEVVEERWEGGRLRWRRFRRIDGAPAGEILVTYEGGMAPDEAPEALVLDNGWLGYRLLITTLATQRL